VLPLCLIACSLKHRPSVDSNASASASPSLIVVADAEPATAPDTMVVARDTRGLIACNDRPCVGGKEACVSHGGHSECKPVSADHSYASVDPAYECDDSSDCAPDAVCCASHMGGGYCQPRGHGGPPLECGGQLCFPDAGAPCPPGETCVKTIRILLQRIQCGGSRPRGGAQIRVHQTERLRAHNAVLHGCFRCARCQLSSRVRTRKLDVSLR
jgi:hypothetical protein